MKISFQPPRRIARWKWVLGFWAGLVVAVLVAFLATWNTFFTYVPPAQHLVVIAKDGGPLPPGHVLAQPGQKGPLETVLAEGWHFVMPIAYEAKLEPNTTIPAGKVGVVTALGGEPLPPGIVLANPGQQGIQRRVLPPGSYASGPPEEELEAEEAGCGSGVGHADPQGGGPPKLMCPERRRRTVESVRRSLGHGKISERRVCRVLC